jgi:predicted MFS family arabinose efflux permease
MSCRSLLFRSGDFALKSPSRSALSTPTTERAHNENSFVTIPITTQNVPTRSIILLAGAGFASQAMVRVTDSLLPQIATDFGTTVGEASIVVAAYAVSHGSIQLIIGPVGDRFGKYRTVAAMCALASLLVALCGMAQSLSALALARFASGAAAGWIIPLSMAYVGDVTPYARRQPILARYLTGQISGQLFGQAAGGVLGDLFGWRNVFFVLAGMFALATAGLLFELLTNPRTRAERRPDEAGRGFVADYVLVLSNPWARVVILAVFIEASIGWGAFAYVGADLHLRFALSFGAIGLIVGMFGVGGLLYCRLGFAAGEPLRPSRARNLRRCASGACLSDAGHRRHLVACPTRGHRNRARLLCAPQHAADECHANDAAGARHCGRDLFLGDLSRPDARRRRGRGCLRPLYRRAAVRGDRHRAARLGVVVRGEAAATRGAGRREGVAATQAAYSRVMAGLVPAIHLFSHQTNKTWMPGTRPGMTDH